ncbi:hypothetical protein PC128_g9795 [Phytophthora cactorum]|nr:hypothetical protein PC128_g9795 [Phytophthora cactorum]
MQLKAEMLDMKKDDFTQRPPPDDEGESIPRSLPADHVLRENPDYQIVNGQRKRRQRQCKVCSNESAASESVELPSTIAQDVVFRTKQGKFFAALVLKVKPAISMCRTYLCNKVWPHTKNNTLTCHQIWHFQWNNGANRPRPRCGRNIQRREAGSGAGKRKRHPRSLSGQNNDNAAEEEAAEDTAADEHATEDAAADQHADEE